MALLVRLPELISRLILVGSGLRRLEWEALLRRLLALILLARRLSLIPWQLSLRRWVLEPCLSYLFP